MIDGFLVKVCCLGVCYYYYYCYHWVLLLFIIIIATICMVK